VPGPHVCNPSGILFFFVPGGGWGGVAVVTRRVTEREKMNGKGEKDYYHDTNAAAS